MSNVLHNTPAKKINQTLTMIYPFYFISIVRHLLQGYPKKMRLGRELYWACLVHFLLFKFPCVDQNWLMPMLNYFVNHQNTSLVAETKIQASNRHIFRVLGRLYSLILKTTRAGSEGGGMFFKYLVKQVKNLKFAKNFIFLIHLCNLMS